MVEPIVCRCHTAPISRQDEPACSGWPEGTGDGAEVAYANGIPPFATILIPVKLQRISGRLCDQHLLLQATLSEVQHAIGAGQGLRPVRDADPRQSQPAHRCVHLLLHPHIQMRRAFVDEQQLRSAIQRPCQQNPLLLAARQELPISPISVL